MNFITVDWIDASWKTTLAKNLSRNDSYKYIKSPLNRSKEEREKMDMPNISTQERYDFYMRSNIEDQEYIRELLLSWLSVVSDRYIESTIVHHLCLDPNINLHSLNLLNLEINTKILLIVWRKDLINRLSIRKCTTRFEENIDHMMEVQDLYISRNFDLVIDTSKKSILEVLNIAKEII